MFKTDLTSKRMPVIGCYINYMGSLTNQTFLTHVESFLSLAGQGSQLLS